MTLDTLNLIFNLFLGGLGPRIAIKYRVSIKSQRKVSMRCYSSHMGQKSSFIEVCIKNLEFLAPP